MDYFNKILTTFLSLDGVRILAVYRGQKALGSHQKYLNLCSEDERRSYGFGTTWGWVINDRIFIFGWTISLSLCNVTTRYQTYSICFMRWRICMNWFNVIFTELYFSLAGHQRIVWIRLYTFIQINRFILWFINVKLLWIDLYCIKCEINKTDSTN